ncbi:MAG: 4-hydroxybenzoate octaprenyltransferase [Rhodospirillaceae bacterium]|nr:4-hydroxybenzoate octaprenyltransferase [Rhodospirillaceae bacterium]
MSSDARSDIPTGSWVDRHLPPPARPYARLARLDRPIGTWLLLLPCWWGLALAPRPGGFGWVDLYYAALFAIGAVVMRGAGCTINDILDRDFDARVARTRTRPLPAGEITLNGAVAFLAAQLLLGFLVLVQFNWTAVAWGTASLALVVTYPLMKRITWWPQAFLGLTFNWGIWVGWVATNGGVGWPPLVLYAAGVAWTIGYDTLYAHQDKEDDALIGVKSTARLWGETSPRWVGTFYGVALAGMVAATLLAGQPEWVAVLVALTGWHLAWQVAFWEMDDPKDCLVRFKSNRDFGLLVALALVIGSVV